MINFCLLLAGLVFSSVYSKAIVAVTWSANGFQQAANKAWDELSRTNNRMHAVLEGLTLCEELRCDGSVGYGGSPDETGETRLDALIFDGPKHKMGAVASLGKIKQAARVAFAVMKYTRHSMLVGDAATNFAIEMGFEEQPLYSNESRTAQAIWKAENCQPNFRKSVIPNPSENCGPYRPRKHVHFSEKHRKLEKDKETGHDTMGIVVVDASGDITVGTTTNGATHKVPGRVGDSPIPGAGGYVDNKVGGAVATGDGDEMMRFLPSYQAVESMRQGYSPQKAAKLAISRIREFHPHFFGGVVAVNKNGDYGAACNGMEKFSFSIQNIELSTAKVLWINCQ